MLVELRVRGLGVVEDVGVSFNEGLTALTGETGAGKTLLVEALAAVLGRRMASNAVRAGSDEALVEARFALDPTEMAPAPSGAAEEGELVVARSVAAQGRGRAWLQGRMATLSNLSELGGELVDIHGQHEQHSLTSAAGQRRALDAFGAIDDRAVRAARHRLRQIDRAMEEAGGSSGERERQAELLRFQLEEIEAASLADAEEDEVLRIEEERLAHTAAHRGAVAEALAALHVDDPDGTAAADLVGQARHVLQGVPGAGEWVGRLETTEAELSDLAQDLRSALETWEEDPAALATVQERRRVLSDLRRKYGPTLADVLSFAAGAAEELEQLEKGAAGLEALAHERADVVAALEDASATVRRQRAAAGRALEGAVSVRLADLAMAGARLEVTVGEGGAGDAVRFLLAANPGEPARPLAEVASGGELARTTLALRLVAPGGPPTVVFDEVDAGVGGQAALALGAALQELATDRQVLAVTHLPQVAAFADHHVVVRKATSAGRTVTEAVEVTDEDRVVEVSRMLSGHPGSDTARAHARELLVAARRGGRPPADVEPTTTV